MFFLISKIGGTVLPNMTGTGIKCYLTFIALYPRPRVLLNRDLEILKVDNLLVSNAI